MKSLHRVHDQARTSLCLAAVLVAVSLPIRTLTARAQAVPSPPEAQPSVEELQADGQVIYSRDCASCHGAEGTSDGAGPALDGNNNLSNKTHVIRQILGGSPEKGMDAFGKTLDDHDVAAVATFVRTAWNNSFGMVRPSEIAPIRAELKIQKTK